uniref:Uncharacterized protein n=1 Tax=uncultured bacterium A1Q1_fos_2067 TaxID=1256560 RepID=L7VUG9_9BACT|nr:hypothetical protein [uncultured bacterium A1Q1_fos_2067]
MRETFSASQLVLEHYAQRLTDVQGLPLGSGIAGPVPQAIHWATNKTQK